MHALSGSKSKGSKWYAGPTLTYMLRSDDPRRSRSDWSRRSPLSVVSFFDGVARLLLRMHALHV